MNLILRKKFAFELKEKILKKESVKGIGYWCFSFYADHILDVDIDFYDILISLSIMEMGEEFELSYERLNEIADDLIAGKNNINLDY